VPPAPGQASFADRRRVRGDLDAIVLKAMAKDPEARYASAEQLAEDLGRFVAQQPVSAREPSAIYLLRKLASRHRVTAAASALALVAVLAGLGVALWQRHVAERERALAEARFADIRALANTLIFTIHDAIVPLPGSTPVRKTIVAEALAYLERLQRESEHDLQLRFELAGAYQRIASVLGYPQAANLGDREGALAALRQAERLIAAQALHPDAPIDTVDRYIGIERQLSTIYKVLGREVEGRAASAAALRRAEQLATRHPGQARARELHAHALFETALGTADPRASVAVWRQAGALYEGLLAERPTDLNRLRNVALVEKYLGARLQHLSDGPGSAQHYQRALDLDERRLALAPDDRQAQLDTAVDLANVALGFEFRQDYARAVALRTRSTEMRRTLARADPQDVLVRGRLGRSLAALARVEARAGRLGPALEHAHEGVAIARSVAAAAPDAGNRIDLADALEALALVEGRGRRREASCRAFREAVGLYVQAAAVETSQRRAAEAGLAACRPI
jgi:hypothetical protein